MNPDRIISLSMVGDTLHRPKLGAATVIGLLLDLFEVCVMAIGIVLIVAGGVYLLFTDRRDE